MVHSRHTTLFRELIVTASVLAVFAVLALAGAAQGVPPQQAASAEVLELGSVVYSEQCASCHGSEGKGNGPAARFLDPKPRDFTSGEWVYTNGDVESLVAIITAGVDDTGMTPFEELLSEEEISAVANYVLDRLVQDHSDRVAAPPR